MAHIPSSNDRDICSNPSAGFFKAGTKTSSSIVWHNCFVSSKFPLHILNLWTNRPNCLSTYCSIHLNQIQSPWTYRQHDLPKHRGKHPTWHKKPEDSRHLRNTLRLHLETKEWEVLYKIGVYKALSGLEKWWYLSWWWRQYFRCCLNKVTMWTHRQFLSIWLSACLIREDTERISN